jgi:hypothetical protein
MLELFVFGTFWFWALVAAEIILLFVLVENETGVGATVSLLVFAALLQFCGNVDIIGFVRTNPLTIVAGLIAYFILGTVWGIIKWRLFCQDSLDEYEEAKAEFLRGLGLPSGTKIIPDEHKTAWANRLQNARKYVNGNYVSLADIPQAKDHKSRILRWMSFWCVSIIWSFMHDFVTRIFNSIYRSIAEFLQRMADSMFANVREDLPRN